MDTLHNVLRSIRSETKSRPDHLSEFRKFLNLLDRLNRRRAPRTAPRHKAAGKRKGERSGKS